MILEHCKLPSAFDPIVLVLRRFAGTRTRYGYFPNDFEYEYRFAEYEYERFETRIERVVLQSAEFVKNSGDCNAKSPEVLAASATSEVYTALE